MKWNTEISYLSKSKYLLCATYVLLKMYLFMLIIM